MNAIEEIERARATELVDEDGERVELELRPPLADAAIDALAEEVGAPLPGELRAVLSHTAGLDGVLDQVDFTDCGGGFGMPDAFPATLAIAHDGFGNFWVLDLVRTQGDAAPVYFACHDPPVILYQGPTLAHFLHELFRMYVPPHVSLVDDVREDRLFDVWGSNPGVLAQPDAASSGDPVVAAFAGELWDEAWSVVDLRGAPPGMGFSWGRHGPRTEVRRHGSEPLFAYRRPERRPGLLRRLLR